MADDRFNYDPGPDPRAVTFLEGKGLKRSWRWTSMWQAEHAYGFTLAGVYRLDVLAAAKQLVTEAVAGGQTLEQFRDGFEARLQTLGFAGPQVVTEHPEGPRKVDLTAPWRVRTIYDTNVRQAYAASEWQAILDTAADFPALQYHHLPQEHPRLQHLAWDAIVLPVTHAFWRSHFPPNGWFCKCWTTQVSVDDLAHGRIKLTAEAKLAQTGYSADPADWAEWTDSRTGRVARVPDGISPGFAYNAGLERRANLGELLQRKIEGMDPDLARAASADLVNLPVFRDLVEDAVALGQAREAARSAAALNLTGGSATKAEIDRAAEEAADLAGTWPRDSWPVGVVPEELAGDLAAGGRPQVVVVNAQAIGHSAVHHPTTADDWRRVQLLLEHGEVRRAGSGDLSLFGQFRTDGGAPRTWSLVLKPLDGAWRVKTLFTSSLSRWRRVAGRTELVREGRGVIELLERGSGG